ncbi:hypothetical protein [Tahibacter caeni]|uniref:hypothetical protein n=1 Tax=Tahibacter caeni TaxID=1453545 RepID=UPI0021477C4C|nr:hypothetical protein [Tahibacter caeni]
MRLKTAIGGSLVFCCGVALAQISVPQTAAAPDPGAASAAAVSIDDEAGAAYERYTQAVKNALGPLYRKLRESAAPRDWMLASQLLVLSMADDDPDFSSVGRAELLRNAAAAAPEDALVQWVAMMAMPSADGGCAAPRMPANLDAVLRLESDNGLAWLPVLSQAWQAKDALAIDSALTRMAAATRYDDHSIEYGQLMIELFRDNPDTMHALGAANAAADEAVDPVQYGLIMSQTLSTPFQVLVRACDRAKQPEADTRRFAICADLGQRLLREGKTGLVSRIGDTVLAKAGLSDDAEAAALRRETAWLTQALADGDVVEQAHRYADALQRHGNELEALRELARARGLSPTPPPTWQPPNWRSGRGDAAPPAEAEDAKSEAEGADD